MRPRHMLRPIDWTDGAPRASGDRRPRHRPTPCRLLQELPGSTAGPGRLKKDLSSGATVVLVLDPLEPGGAGRDLLARGTQRDVCAEL
jgi:hypothetical protein